jgi:hypothetical protein
VKSIWKRRSFRIGRVGASAFDRASGLASSGIFPKITKKTPVYSLNTNIICTFASQKSTYGLLERQTEKLG